MAPARIEVHDNREGSAKEIELDLERLRSFAPEALAEVLRLERGEDLNGPLPDLEAVEVSLVDDSVIARVHEEFMDIAGATDVITFDHGEIVISVETALKQAEEFGSSMMREVALYMTHGLLHLLGFDDREPGAAARMAETQEAIVARCWKEGEAC